MYYPRSAGGGRKELFRKVGDRSSEFYPDRNQVRRDGSYVYEEFLTTEGTDVKVYAVTGAYANAEARKSPTMDGKVVRDENQLEMRYPVTLSPFEKELAVRICDAFKQRVCGFDMLRSNGKTYVCDVNGWSFVKRNTRHLKDSAMILTSLLKNSLGRLDLITNDDDSVIDDESAPTVEDAIEPPKRGKLHEELRAVITIIRHGDRTPKQKLKMKTSAKRFLQLLKDGSSEVKLKTAADLSNVLSIINELLEEYPSRPSTPATPMPSPSLGLSTDSPKAKAHEEEMEETLLQARAVLEIGGSFKGINRKVQLKATKFEKDPCSGREVPTEAVVIIKWGGVLTPLGRAHAEQLGRSFRERLYPGVDGLLRLHSTYRHDLKIYSSDEGRVQVSAAAFAKGLLDLEGHLTPLLASLVRKGDDVNVLLDDSSGAIEEMEKAKVSLRLSMGVSAASSTSSLMEDDSPQRTTTSPSPGAASVVSVKQAIAKLREDIPGAMERLHMEIRALCGQLKQLVKAIRQRPVRGTSAAAAVPVRNFARTQSDDNKVSSTPVPPGGGDVTIDGGSAAASLGFVSTDPNTKMIDRGDGAVTLRDMLQLSYGRWEKLFRDFYKPKTKTFDISKLPDVYDSAKYDVIHNRELLDLVPKHLHMVYHLSKCLADIVVPQEYGETPIQKFVLGSKLARKLAGKIRADLINAGSPQQETEHRLDTRFAKELGIKSTNRHVLTRVYFTSESHMHSILNILRFAHLADSSVVAPPANALQRMEAVEELDYLSHVVLRLFEVTKEDGSKRTIVRVAFSPGVNVDASFDDRTRTIQKVEVGYSETPEGKLAAEHLRRYSHAVHQLPPAAPLIPLWTDVNLADLVKLLDSVEKVPESQASG